MRNRGGIILCEYHYHTDRAGIILPDKKHQIIFPLSSQLYEIVCTTTIIPQLIKHCIIIMPQFVVFYLNLWGKVLTFSLQRGKGREVISHNISDNPQNKHPHLIIPCWRLLITMNSVHPLLHIFKGHPTYSKGGDLLHIFKGHLLYKGLLHIFKGHPPFLLHIFKGHFSDYWSRPL